MKILNFLLILSLPYSFIPTKYNMRYKVISFYGPLPTFSGDKIFSSSNIKWNFPGDFKNFPIYIGLYSRMVFWSSRCKCGAGKDTIHAIRTCNFERLQNLKLLQNEIERNVFSLTISASGLICEENIEVCPYVLCNPCRMLVDVNSRSLVRTNSIVLATRASFAALSV